MSNLTTPSQHTTREGNTSDGDVACDEPEEDEYELVLLRKRSLRLGRTAPTTHGTSRFGSSQEESGGKATLHVGDSGVHHCVSKLSCQVILKMSSTRSKKETALTTSLVLVLVIRLRKAVFVDEDDSDQESGFAAAETAHNREEEEGDSEEPQLT
ncbi:hypothetical protein DVH05_011293 [Phytophthora capsici]|nr:hypothetical protein DVH05_011293 [Phytophthora capsici]